MKIKPEVREILVSNLYCNLATVCEDNSPWNSPVFFGYDDDMNLYWRSSTESVHSRNIDRTYKVFITVYDGQVAWGKGNGVYLQGTAARLENQAEVKTALQYLDARTSQKSEVQEFLGDNPRRVYKFVPSDVWTNKDARIKGKFVDTREKAV
jgi:nitroimidazol reductase NimA-like FMN-containing flavoprotein (pyridoxamine 5'-phosphate oxidase superfamily)